jgi:glyoxalase family protein
MPDVKAPDLIQGNHHLTFCVGPAQEDFDFHTQTLGLRSIKKTALYDGVVPVYHLYYGNAYGDPGTILTSFPFRQQGIKGRLGTNQITRLNLSVPKDSIGFWADRLKGAGIKNEETELWGTQRLHFNHPCGLPYGLVADGDGDQSRSYDKGGVSADNAILGSHGITITVAYPDEMLLYLDQGVGAKKVDESKDAYRFQLGSSGRGRSIELFVDPSQPAATWFFGEGTVHHCAWDIGGAEPQLALKTWLEGLGYTDCTEVKDRGYFMSVYNRTPSGALFEYAWSKPEGWSIDEDPDHWGESMQIPPVFADRAKEIVDYLEPLETAGAAR